MTISPENYEYCELCPRKCHADRRAGERGFCGMGPEAVLARAMLHPWEEPGITANGAPSGAVFFTGCTMQCIYCQNRKISDSGPRVVSDSGPGIPVGVPRTAEQMAQIFLRLQKEGGIEHRPGDAHPLPAGYHGGSGSLQGSSHYPRGLQYRRL